jgi:formamidopyrimidine-DNA glycosylase
MPELPEVETARRGLAPMLVGRHIERVVVRQRQLRWPVPRRLERALRGQRVEALERRAKYLLLRSVAGTALLHLGMSGSLRVLPAETAPGPHDHVDFLLQGGTALRLRDPRRFGALLWTTGDPYHHERLRHLGPEPLGDQFDGAYLRRCLGGRRAAIKTALMDSRLVVGVGNIYASEALFRAGVRPTTAAGSISALRCARIASAVKQVLAEAIAAGGTTLRDFSRADGRPGYFQQELAVYGRVGEPCPSCGRAVKMLRQGQRSTYYCAGCQR